MGIFALMSVRSVKNVFLILVFLIPAASGFSQLDPVKWEARAVHRDAEDIVELLAIMEGEWHIYSQHLPSDEGPIPTQFHWDLPSGVKLVGEVVEDEAQEVYDKNFMMNVRYFSQEATFTQKLLIGNGNIKGEAFVTVTYMVCNDEMCLPPKDQNITVKLN